MHRRDNSQNEKTDSGSERRTTFSLAEENGETEEGMRRLLHSVEHAARRVVRSTHFNRNASSPTRTLSTSVSVAASSQQPILGVKGDEYFQPPSPLTGEMGMVNIRRPVYSQNAFAQLFEETSHVEDANKSRFFNPDESVSERKVRCRNRCFGIFPFISMLRNYSVKRDLLLDVVSGLTTGIMRIPQSMAYAMLARLSPIFGLYTAFFSAVLYFVFGGSHHMAAGAQGVISLMVGAGVDRILAQGSANYTIPDAANDSIPGDIALDPRIIDITVTLTFLVGITQLLLGIFHLGFITNYLSDPLIGGFTTGAACHVVISQLPTMLGIKIDSHAGNFNVILSIVSIFANIHLINWITFCISLISLVFIFILKLKAVNDRFRKKLKIPIPGELLILASSILFSYLTEANARWKVKVVGAVPSGFMTPRLPDPAYMGSIFSISFPTAIVSFAIGYSISKRLALLNDYEINGNQEMFAFGFMNTTSSFFNCFATTASMSTSSLHESLGGKTQIANLIASLLVLVTLLFAGPLFQPAPECVLSVILLINLKTILCQFVDLTPLWIVSKIDFLLWIVTWLAVIILDVDLGLGIGVAFSLLTIVFRTQWPYTCILGRIPSTDIYKNRSITPNAHEIPGIKIFRFEGSLYFASADHFRNSLYKETNCNPVKIMRYRRELKEKLAIVKQRVRESLVRIGSSTSNFLAVDEFGQTNSDHDRLLTLEKANLHHVIIDFSACSFIDSVGVRTLTQIVQDYEEVEIFLYLANVRAAVRSMLLHTSVFTSQNGVCSKCIFLTVHDAVLSALEHMKKMEERDFIMMDAGGNPVTRQASVYASDID